MMFLFQMLYSSPASSQSHVITYTVCIIHHNRSSSFCLHRFFHWTHPTNETSNAFVQQSQSERLLPLPAAVGTLHEVHT
ncbi:hypothetical protein F4803DRAFT_513128 [Xylaria telfairii]|nr:hypothetical protein F4803DRAFT_513128 [Xylaria telfairii]